MGGRDKKRKWKQNGIGYVYVMKAIYTSESLSGIKIITNFKTAI